MSGADQVDAGTAAKRSRFYPAVVAGVAPLCKGLMDLGKGLLDLGKGVLDLGKGLLDLVFPPSCLHAEKPRHNLRDFARHVGAGFASSNARFVSGSAPRLPSISVSAR